VAVPFGIGFLWLGYSVLYYGYNRITGGNDKFLDLIYPGRYHAVTRDDGSGSASAAPSKPAASKPKAAAKAAATPNLNAIGNPLSSTRSVTPQ
jgi:hypothetical protein